MEGVHGILFFCLTAYLQSAEGIPCAKCAHYTLTSAQSPLDQTFEGFLTSFYGVSEPTCKDQLVGEEDCEFGCMKWDADITVMSAVNSSQSVTVEVVSRECAKREDPPNVCQDLTAQSESSLNQQYMLQHNTVFTVRNWRECVLDPDRTADSTTTSTTTITPPGGITIEDDTDAATTVDPFQCIRNCNSAENGQYNKCGKKCSNSIICIDGKVVEQQCSGRKGQWDSKRQKCVVNSDTCP